jgi:hypothetical protein
MPKRGGKINVPMQLVLRVLQKLRVWVCNFQCGSHVKTMNYILAILLPPLSILLTGRPILGIVVFIIWIPALIFSGGLTHPMFILLAWLLIFQSREDRRAG